MERERGQYNTIKFVLMSDNGSLSKSKAIRNLEKLEMLANKLAQEEIKELVKKTEKVYNIDRCSQCNIRFVPLKEEEICQWCVRE